MANEDEVLKLAEQLATDDEAGLCYINDLPSRDDCRKRGTILIGEVAELAYCADHSAELVLQLLALRPVQEALLRRETAILILDDSNAAGNELQGLETLLDLAVPTAAANQELQNRLRGWTAEKLQEMSRLVPDRQK